MATLKRATKMIRDAGIEHIVVCSGLWGPVVEDTRLRHQQGKVFKTWKQAAEAVIGGYRPIDLDAQSQPTPAAPAPSYAQPGLLADEDGGPLFSMPVA